VGVLGAGGGREVLALAARGYAVTGYECNPALRRAGSVLLAEAGIDAELLPLARDAAPSGGGPYDGVVIGWSTYSLVLGRHRRVALLRALRDHVAPGAPLLASHFTRPAGGDRRSRAVTTVAGTTRRLRRAEPVEPGDDLGWNAFHRFTRAEVESELAAGGFATVACVEQGPGPIDPGVTVGTAVDEHPRLRV
jgi:hypothetical protein